VQLKIKKIMSRDPESSNKLVEKTLIQIIDVSHKVLYNQAKAEQTYLTLVNASVSHELRNPLSSLIG
jgi:signal transduction histidine kinase